MRSLEISRRVRPPFNCSAGRSSHRWCLALLASMAFMEKPQIKVVRGKLAIRPVTAVSAELLVDRQIESHRMPICFVRDPHDGDQLRVLLGRHAFFSGGRAVRSNAVAAAIC